MDKYINQIVLIKVDKDDNIPFVGEKGQIVAIEQHRNVDTSDGTTISVPYDVVFQYNFDRKIPYAEEETILTSEE